MKKELTLLVLAAGMGSRFGGLKQIEPVGPSGEFIIDYSIKDAILAGFTKVVFVIKEENYEVFKKTIGKRIENKIKVEYAFQKMNDIPKGIKIPETRKKPLGTAHAIYSARNVVHENFATINADDFYGRDAYIKAAEFLRNCEDNEYAIIAYKIGNTLTDNGEVKRGVIKEENGYLVDLLESSVKEENGMCKGCDLNGNNFATSLDSLASMNLFCLTPALVRYIENNLIEFLDNPKTDLEKDEYLLPRVVVDSAKLNNKKIKIIPTESIYLGVTYKEDLETLKNGIAKLIANGIYNRNLWE